MNEQSDIAETGVRVAERLVRHHLRIHRLWEERVRARAVARSSAIDGPALSEVVPGLLNRLAAALSSGKAEARPSPGAARPHLALAQVLEEHQVLRQVLLEVLEEERPLPTRDRNTLLELLDRELLHDARLLARPNAPPVFQQLLAERDRLQASLNQLQGEMEYRKRFVATVAHDLRSPLAATKSAAQMIVRDPENLERVRLWGERIAEAVGRVDSMVSNLLDVNRLEAGERITATFALCDLKRVAESLHEELRTRHGDRFRLKTEGITLGFWSGDGLRRVLDNLLSNAVKYGGPGTPISTTIQRVDDRVTISVHNQGSFIPPEEREPLFRPYHRSASAEASGQSGWGLGLVLVRGIVESHHGVVRMESDRAAGTTFVVDLPVDSRSFQALQQAQVDPRH